MDPNRIFENLNTYLSDPSNTTIDLTQRLDNDNTIIEEAIRANDDMAIQALLQNIAQQIISGKIITINFNQPTNSGSSTLYQDIIAKSIYSMQLHTIMDSLVSIHNRSENKIDWNAPVFHEGNSLILECARLGHDNIVQQFVARKDNAGIPLFKINQQNNSGLRVIDYYKERIDNREQPAIEIDNGAPGAQAPVMLANGAIGMPPFQGPGFNLDFMMQIVGALRKSGSLEPQKEFIPLTGKLDTENVHSASNEPIVATIMGRLRDTYRDIDVDKEIAELYQYIKDLALDSQIKGQAISNLDNFESANNINEHNTNWIFRNEIAYLWCEAKTLSNQTSMVYTLSELSGCYWGQLVNLCRTSEGFDYLDLVDSNSRSNEIIVKRITNQIGEEFGNADIPQIIFELSSYVESNRPELNPNLIQLLQADVITSHNVTWKFDVVLAHIWNKAKFAENQIAILKAIEVLEVDPWDQLLKICHVAELKPKNAFIVDFSSLQNDETKQNEISNSVFNKLKAQIPDVNILAKVIMKWSEEQIKSCDMTFKNFSVEKEMVDGVFHEVFLEMISSQGKHTSLAYSVDFKQFANIVNYIAGSIEYYDENTGNELYDFILKAPYLESINFITRCNIETFSNDFEIFRQAHDCKKFNFNIKNTTGRPLIFELLDRISSSPVEEIKRVLDIIMNKDLVEVDWTILDNMFNNFADEQYHQPAFEKLYNIRMVSPIDDIMDRMVSILSNPAVYSSKIIHDFIRHISTPGYYGFNMADVEIFKAIIESKGAINIAKVKDAELLITFFQSPDFAERLDIFVEKHGFLDMGMKVLSGKSMLVHMIETVGVSFETFIILMNNPQITNVNWVDEDSEGHSALEALYKKSAPNMGPVPNNDALGIITMLLSSPDFDCTAINDEFWRVVLELNAEDFISFQDLIAPLGVVSEQDA